MGVNLSDGAISKVMRREWESIDLKPVLQVIDIGTIPPASCSEGSKERYRIELSDGSLSQNCMIAARHNELVRSRLLRKGSVIQLTDFVCPFICGRIVIVIMALNVIVDKTDIVGDPKPFILNKTPSNTRSTMPTLEEGHHPNENVDEPLASTKESSSLLKTQSKKRKGRPSMESNILAVAKDVSKIARMIMEKNKEDDMGACIQKLDMLGWEIPMYDTALLLFGQSADFRKLWLHLKTERCVNWVRNAGSQFGLLG